MRLFILLMVWFFFVGCASFEAEHSRTLLMDRKTGEMKDCTVGLARSQGAYDKYEECIRSLEAEGYTIWSQY